MPTVLKDSNPVARKSHKCSACLGVIEKGVKYHRQTCKYDGEVYEWKECQPCSALLPEVDWWAGVPDEGVTSETFYEWATENVDDEKWGAEARAYLDRGVPS